MDKGTLVGHVARELKLPARRVRQIITLMEEGCSVPFIARFRKDMTGNLGEGAIRRVHEALVEFDEFQARKAKLIAELEQKEKLTDDLRRRIEKALSTESLDECTQAGLDRSAAEQAQSLGLTPLAMMIRMQRNPWRDIQSLAQRLGDLANGIADADAAIQGALDIITIQIAEEPENRKIFSDYVFKRARVVSKVIEGKEEEGQSFKQYFDFSESFEDVAARDILGIRRGASLGFLTFEIQVNVERAIKQFSERFIHTTDERMVEHLHRAVQQVFEKTLFPPLLESMRKTVFREADMEAVMTCKKNLRNLLLTPPGRGMRVLGIDPAFKGGCRIAALDENGNVLETSTIYLGQSKKRKETGRDRIQQLVETHKIEAISIGKGTGHRQVEEIVQAVTSTSDGKILKAITNRSGAAEYASSEVGASELPGLEEACRIATSIGRRFQDPLFELAKVEPCKLQVGPYQAQVCQDLLRAKMNEVMESCVSLVGLDLNTASPVLLSKLPGATAELAQAIAARRAQSPFKNLEELKTVEGVNEKTFEQIAGFVRIADGDEPLDRTGIHPENYDVVRRLASDIGAEPGALIGNTELLEKIDWEKYVTEEVGRRTLKSIQHELLTPGQDPRESLQRELFEGGLQSAAQLSEGMILPGTVTNVTKFGAFIDLGARLEGLVHVSQLSKRFVQDPTRVVHIGERVMVKVLRIDRQKNRVSLSIKQAKGKHPSPIPSLESVQPPPPVIAPKPASDASLEAQSAETPSGEAVVEAAAVEVVTQEAPTEPEAAGPDSEKTAASEASQGANTPEAATEQPEATKPGPSEEGSAPIEDSKPVAPDSSKESAPAAASVSAEESGEQADTGAKSEAVSAVPESG
ncbi:MAG: S1 RNA-binding domain-containing protein [Planctomycetota bacterium]|nr:S1 RNA-binding domain-containing protein [Planctomycetota bacterium]